MKKQILLTLVAPLLLISSCGQNTSKSSDIISSSKSESISSEQSESIISSTSEESSSITSSIISSSSIDYPLVDDLIWFPDQKMEVGQKLYINNFLRENDDVELLFENESVLYLEDDYLVAKKEGTSFFLYHAKGKYQKIVVDIAPKGTYQRAYTFAEGDLAGKNVVVFGDSVAADATVGDTQSVYPRRFAKKFKMNFLNNYAIGGSTATLCFKGSNIYKEYGKTIYETIDGCHQVYEKLSKGELDNVDYLILNYGYNDLYYQVDITVDGDDVYCVDDTYACCKSFKGSYRYMVNCARKANPNVKIILMNMMFTKYTYDDGGYPAGYHFNKGIKIHDYRKAIFELSEELDAKIVDAYNYMKEQYDYDPERPQSTTWVYKDTVHYTVYGQKKIADYFYKW